MSVLNLSTHKKYRHLRAVVVYKAKNNISVAVSLCLSLLIVVVENIFSLKTNLGSTHEHFGKIKETTGFSSR